MNLGTRQFDENAASPPNRVAAFTLIELLVVIAIISLLVSILLPSLQKARELAKMVACEAKVRNIGIATAMYLGDYSGKYPFTYQSEPVNYVLHTYLPYYSDPSNKSTAGENWTCPVKTKFRDPSYGANPGFSRGTETNAWAGSWGRIQEEMIPHPANTIWVVEGGWRGYPDDTYVADNYDYYKLTSDHFTWKTSDVPWNWESVVWGPPWFQANVISWAKVSLRHLQTANVVFAEGHVESLDIDALDDNAKWLLPR